MKFENMTQEQKDATLELGVHLRDSLGVLNGVLKMGGIVQSEWSQLLDTFSPSWKKYQETFGITIDDATRLYVKKVLAT